QFSIELRLGMSAKFHPRKSFKVERMVTTPRKPHPVYTYRWTLNDMINSGYLCRLTRCRGITPKDLLSFFYFVVPLILYVFAHWWTVLFQVTLHAFLHHTLTVEVLKFSLPVFGLVSIA
ncbi:MAG: hypothetical protein LBL24_01425, partial [Bacteroidales bacterium]|nr:hypothetical protein [Bacteroidales bacterium]